MYGLFTHTYWICCLSRHLPQSWWFWISVIWIVWRTWWLRCWSVMAMWMCWSVTAVWSWRPQCKASPWNWTGTSWTSTTLAPALWPKVSKTFLGWSPPCNLFSGFFPTTMLTCPKHVAGVLPPMISRRAGHIVLVNSIQGRLAVPFRSSCELPPDEPNCSFRLHLWIKLQTVLRHTSLPTYSRARLAIIIRAMLPGDSKVTCSQRDSVLRPHTYIFCNHL